MYFVTSKMRLSTVFFPTEYLCYANTLAMWSYAAVCGPHCESLRHINEK